MTHGSRLRVPALTRVEGEGGLEIVVSDGQVTQARLDIYEPPRFFEALLRGRRYTEPPDITAPWRRPDGPSSRRLAGTSGRGRSGPA